MSLSDLFGDDATNSATGETGDVKTGPLLLTNGPNLIHCRSLGYVGPVESFGPDDKYYSDFLEEAPGRLPLFTESVSSELVDYVRRESPRTARPVLLEFAPDSMPRVDVPVLDAGGEPINGSANQPNAPVSAPALVLPFTAVRRVIFLTEEDKEVTLRGFSNVRPIPADIIVVSEALVAGGNPGLEAVLSWLGDLEEPDGPSHEAFRSENRTAGAIALAAHSRPDLTDELLALLRLEPPSSALPSWFAYLSDPTLEESLRDPDARVFAATLTVLRKSSTKEWRPQEVLDEVRERVLTGDLEPEHETSLGRGMETISKILSNEVEFKPSVNQLYPALQALRLFLIRTEPMPLLQWTTKETQAGDLAHLIAAVYAGLLVGRAQLPLALREQELDLQIADITARKLSLLELPKPAAATLAPSADIGQPAAQDAVSLLLEADLEADDTYRRAAIDLCGYLDWKDCVRSHVVFPDADQQSPAAQYTSTGSKYNKRKLTTWSVPGVVELSYELDVPAFRSRLMNEKLSDRDRKRVQRALDGLSKDV